MNTIKFSKKQNLTTEQHDLERVKVTGKTLFGTDLLLYTPCNLTIFVTEACQNACFFCINRRGNARIRLHPLTDEEYINGLTRLFEEIDPADFEVTITGGEPTLDPHRFVQTMRLCRKYGLRCRTVSTTGIHLLSMYEGKPLCQHMVENGFLHNINIGRMHYDEKKNQAILKGQNISNEDIQKLALFYRLNEAEMRVSCNLVKGYIDDFEQMMKYVGFYAGLGVETIMFRELVGDDNIILENIVNKRLRDFNYIKTSRGLVYEVDVYSHEDWIVKHYRTRQEIEKDVVYNLSYKNGTVRDGFSGKRLDVRVADKCSDALEKSRDRGTGYDKSRKRT